MPNSSDPSRRSLLHGAVAAATSLPLLSIFSPPAHAATPTSLYLPQEDPERSKRRKQLGKKQDRYEYTYDKSSLRGIAMCASLGAAELPKAAWVTEIAKVVADIGANFSALNRDLERSDPEHADHRAVGDKIRSAGHDGFSEAIGNVLDQAVLGSDTGHANQTGDYAELFQRTRLPNSATETQLDAAFARQRLTGPNPGWLRQVAPGDGIPDDFGVTEEYFAASRGKKDSLSGALSEGRLFLCEYRELLDGKPGCYPVPGDIEVDYAKDPDGWDAAYKVRESAYAAGQNPKRIVAPLALFAVPPGGGPLAPVAIQLFPNGWNGSKYPVFTPRDGSAWNSAKISVNNADTNVHELISHLGLTHLVQEAFCLAMHNCLAPRHPLNRLLAPHFEGTFLINTAADSSLVNPSGAVDMLLNSTIGSGIEISAKARSEYDFNASIFPRLLDSRGVAETRLLPDYGYRDDGLLVWGATETWVRDYVSVYYPSDAVVAADSELQAFVRQVGQYKSRDKGRIVGGGVNGVGEDGAGVGTRAYLVQMLTQIIWNGSGQHAAVNFPQADAMIHAPLFPMAMFDPMPKKKLDFTDEAFLAMLPPMDLARIQLGMLDLLGSLYHTQLGDYRSGPTPWFENPKVLKHQTSFTDTLAGVEQTILERNVNRPSYTHLLPSRIPQSINI